MPWHYIGELARCAGRHDLGTGLDGKLRSRRCKTVLVIGARFLLHDSKPYCEACAKLIEQPSNAAEPRHSPSRLALDVGHSRVLDGGRGSGRAHGAR